MFFIEFKLRWLNFMCWRYNASTSQNYFSTTYALIFVGRFYIKRLFLKYLVGYVMQNRLRKQETKNSTALLGRAS